MTTPGCRLYLLTPPALAPAEFAPRLAAALDGGDVAAVQLRLKGADDDTWRRAIDTLRPLAQSRGVAFLLNDRADLVRAHGCDGAHLGQADMPARDARRLLGPDLTLGITCHASRDLALHAGEAGADYVAFGAFFPSPSKPQASPADAALIAWWAELMELPCVAIGGITAENCAPLIAAGADFLAVCSAVWDQPDAAAAVAGLTAAMAESEKRRDEGGREGDAAPR